MPSSCLKRQMPLIDCWLDTSNVICNLKAPLHKLLLEHLKTKYVNRLNRKKLFDTQFKIQHFESCVAPWNQRGNWKILDVEWWAYWLRLVIHFDFAFSVFGKSIHIAKHSVKGILFKPTHSSITKIWHFALSLGYGWLPLAGIELEML